MKTTADLEREAYISGNIFLADLYAKMQDLEEYENSHYLVDEKVLYGTDDDE